MPSMIEFATGKILASVNIPLHDIPLRQLLTERMGVPVYVENDAGCAALAEAFEDGQIDRRLAGHVHDRHRRRRRLGAQRAPVPRRDDVGGRGRAHDHRARPRVRQQRARATRSRSAGRWRRWPRGRALDRLADYAAIQYRDSYLGKMLAPRRATSTATTSSRAPRRATTPSLWCLRVLGERIGIGIANAINTFDPLEVVIGGGVSRAGELLLEPARDAAFRHVVPGLGLNTTIRIARHGPRAGVLGRGADRRPGVRRGHGPEPAGRHLRGGGT